jgi:branched-chain amino acid transport system ATP-binding protein
VTAQKDYALEIVRLNKSFVGLPVTQDVSMTIRPGERRLLLGPNGAGKTTLFNQITKFCRIPARSNCSGKTSQD